MNNQKSNYESGFKCDVSLFLEGVNNANLAKSSVRSNVLTANTMLDIEGMGEVIECLNKCNIELLVSKIEECKNSLLKIDNDFADEYFKLISDLITGLDKENIEQDYSAEYSIYEKEYWNTLVNMLEKNEDLLNDEMKKQLEIAKAMAGYYNVTDEMGSSNTDSEKLIDLLGEKKKYEEELLKLNGNLEGEDLEQELAKLDEKYNIAILEIKSDAAQKKMLGLDINAEDYEEQCVNLLKEQIDYQKQMVMASKDLTEEEIQENLALLDDEYDKNIILIKNNILTNEYGKLDITADNYIEKGIDLLSKQKEYAEQLLRLDKSLTEEQLNEQLSGLNLQYKYSCLMTEANKIQSNIDNLDIEAEDYEETRLELLTEQRKRVEEMLRMNKNLTEDQINEQLSFIDQEIRRSEQNIEWNEMNVFEKGLQYVGTYYLSGYLGIFKVAENIFDGLAMIVGLFGNEEKISELVQTDIAAEAYSAIADAIGINDNAAYSKVHDFGNAVGNVLAYAALTFATAGIGTGATAVTLTTAKIATGTLGALAAGGSASERALNSGATFEQAFLVGSLSGTLGYATGVWSSSFTAGLKDKVYSSLWEVGLDALKAGGIGVIEPTCNSILEYNTYAKDLKDENGNLLYEDFVDYYVETGTPLRTAVGFTSAFLPAAVRGYKSYSNYNKTVNLLAKTMEAEDAIRGTDDADIGTNDYSQDGLDIDDSTFKNQSNELMDSLTQEQRTNAWAEYYSETYGDAFEGKFSGHGDAIDPTSYVDPMAEISNFQLEKQNVKVTYEAVKESIKKSAHEMSTAADFQQLDASIDTYYENTTRNVAEYDAWNIAEKRLEKSYPDFSDLPKDDRNALISAEANKLKADINNTPGANYFEQLINSKGLTDNEKLGILDHTYTIADTAKINGKFALTGVDGAPNSHVTIEEYYHDNSLKDQGALNSSTTQAYENYVKNGFKNSNGTNTVSSIYSNDNLKYVINIPGESDADILQISMWDREPIIEVDITGKSFGRLGDRQFVSPISDSNQLFSNIQNAKSPVDTQEIVGAATGLPTSGNDRLTRISLDTTEQPELHIGTESGSCKEALSGGLPVYKVDGTYYKMREATINSINIGQSDINKLNLIIDNFDPKTGELISKYKLIVTEDGKTFLKLLQ